MASIRPNRAAIRCPRCGTTTALADLGLPGTRYQCDSCHAVLTLSSRRPPTTRTRSLAEDIAHRHKYLLLMAAVGILSTIYHTLGNALPYNFGYTDVSPFYRIWASLPGLPYIDKPIEYPVLTGLFIDLAATIGRIKAGYFLTTAFALTACAIAATAFLQRATRGERNRELAIYWIFAPSMLFFLVYNWDMLAVACVAAAGYFMLRDRPNVAAALLAVGFCFKMYPAILLLPLMVKARGWPERVKIGGIFAVVALTINAPFMLANYEGWHYFISFHSERLPNPDSIWAVVSALVPQLTIPQINMLSLIMFLSSAVVLMCVFRREHIIKLCLIVTLLFLIFNKVFSPQYTLWLLPLFILLPMTNRRAFYSLELVNLVVLFTTLFYLSNAAQDGGILNLVRVFVVLRHVCLVYLLLHVVGWTTGVSHRFALRRRFPTIAPPT